jgi:hypothetical protein
VLVVSGTAHLSGMGGSSSGRKQARAARARASFRPQRPPPDGERPVQVELDFAEHAITSGVGFDLLCRMGFEPNHAPHANPQGRPPTPGRTAANAPPPTPELTADSATPAGLAPLPVSSGSDAGRTTQPIKIVVRTTRAGLGAAEVVHAHSLPTGVGARASTIFGMRVYGAIGPPGTHQHPATTSCDPGSATTLASSLDALSLGSLANDPLRPRCGFNSNHVVADLKQKQRHEKRCHDNPNRNSRSSLSPGGGSAAAFLQSSGPPSYEQHQTAEQASSTFAENDMMDQDMSDEGEGVMSDVSSQDDK